MPATPPRRGTRPANRRELILGAARELFLAHGYDQTGVGDIAAAVAIGPSALYRHFPRKQQILSELLRHELGVLSSRVEGLDAGDRELTVGVLASLAVEFRGLGLLVEREGRHLPADERAQMRDQVRGIARRVDTWLRTTRPGLDSPTAHVLAWAVVGIIASPGVHRIQLDRDELEAMLRELVGIVVHTPLPDGFTGRRRGAVDRSASPTPRSRRENLLAEAVRLFAERGYPSIAVEDVGGAQGIAGPSVYNHFPSKLDLLHVPLQRGLSYLLLDLARAYDGARDESDALRRLIRSYVRFALGQYNVVQLLVSEVRHLPEPLGDEMRHSQREYLQEWGALLQGVSPGLSVNAARTRVQATIAMVNDLVRIPHLREIDRIDEVLVLLCDQLLLVDRVSPDQ